MIDLNNIMVNAIQNASGIFVGTNQQSGWSSHHKTNQGFGAVTGARNIFEQLTPVIYDNDQVDTPIHTQDQHNFNKYTATEEE